MQYDFTCCFGYVVVADLAHVLARRGDPERWLEDEWEATSGRSYFWRAGIAGTFRVVVSNQPPKPHEVWGSESIERRRELEVPSGRLVIGGYDQLAYGEEESLIGLSLEPGKYSLDVWQGMEEEWWERSVFEELAGVEEMAAMEQADWWSRRALWFALAATIYLTICDRLGWSGLGGVLLGAGIGAATFTWLRVTMTPRWKAMRALRKEARCRIEGSPLPPSLLISLSAAGRGY